jgi:hypothetical protein
MSNASQYYTDKVNLHKKYLKLSTGVEVLSHIDSMFYQDKERELQQDMIRKISDHL